MTLNKTKIEWCSRTWNPVTGCLNGCSYCYAKRTAENPFYKKAFPHKFRPHFYPERLGEPSKETRPQTIFVCSMADLFGEWVPDKWIEEVLFQCSEYPRHTYIFLTKNPIRYLTTVEGKYDHLLRDTMWFGTTVTGREDNGRISYLQAFDHKNVFVSYEPLLENPGDIDLTYIKGVIIGEQTKPKISADFKHILQIQKEADRCGTKVFCKDSLSYLNVGDKNNFFRRELCWSVNK